MSKSSTLRLDNKMLWNLSAFVVVWFLSNHSTALAWFTFQWFHHTGVSFDGLGRCPSQHYMYLHVIGPMRITPHRKLLAWIPCSPWANGSNSAGQSNEATHPATKWSLSDRFMFNPDYIFCHTDRCKKVKKAHYWAKEPPSKFEFGGEEIVTRTAEAKKNHNFLLWIKGYDLCVCEDQRHPGCLKRYTTYS